MKLDVINFPSSFFQCNREAKMLFSTTEKLDNRHLQPLWHKEPFSNGFGFGITSDKTGEVVYFKMDDILIDKSGDTIGWKYISVKSEYKDITVYVLLECNTLYPTNICLF